MHTLHHSSDVVDNTFQGIFECHSCHHLVSQLQAAGQVRQLAPYPIIISNITTSLEIKIPVPSCSSNPPYSSSYIPLRRIRGGFHSAQHSRSQWTLSARTLKPWSRKSIWTASDTDGIDSTFLLFYSLCHCWVPSRYPYERRVESSNLSVQIWEIHQVCPVYSFLKNERPSIHRVDEFSPRIVLSSLSRSKEVWPLYITRSVESAKLVKRASKMFSKLHRPDQFTTVFFAELGFDRQMSSSERFESLAN